MKKLLVNEIRKTLQIRSTYIYAIVTLVISLFLAWFCVSLTGADLVGDDGSIIILKGSSAIPVQKQCDSALQGEITEEKIADALRIVKNSYDEKTDDFTYSEEVINNYKIWNMISNLLYVYPQFNNNELGNGLISEIPTEIADNYYGMRAEKISRMINNLYSDSIQLQKAEKLSADVDVPFSYYAGFSSWETVFEYYSLLLIVVLIVAALFAAPVFAEGYSNGADAIFRTTKYGRKSLGVVRVIVSLLYGLVLLLISSLSFLGISIYYFGTEGLKSSIQMMNIYSIANLTFGQVLIYMVLGGIISIMGTVSLVTFFSAKIKKPVSATIISIVLIIGYKAVSVFFPTSSSVDFILTTLPMSGTAMPELLLSLNIFNILNVAVWEPYWSIISGIFVFIVFFFAAVNGYARKKY